MRNSPIELKQYLTEIRALRADNPNFTYLCQIHISYECNALPEAQCPRYCYQPHKNGIHMATETFQRIVNHHTPRQIALGGGEPTCHPHLLDLVRYAKIEAQVPTRHVNYTTNAVALPKAFDELKTLVSGVSVSLDAIRYPHLFKEGPPAQVEENIATYVHSPIKVFLNYVINGETVRTLPEAVEFARQRGLAGLYILGYKEAGKGVPFSVADFKQAFSRAILKGAREDFVVGLDCCLTSFESRQFRCTAGRRVQTFDVDGTPHPCSFAEQIKGAICPYLAGIPPV